VAEVLVAAGAPWLAVGDGAVRYREQLERAGATVPGDASPLHRVSAEAICKLGLHATVTAELEAILPDYRRRPDAEIALESAAR
jgi:tRNA threonylcarbamoyladenosine biosynthesis protein TsaB